MKLGKKVIFLFQCERNFVKLGYSTNFFESYFNLGSLKDEAWIRNPFRIDFSSIDDDDPNKGELN